MQRAAGPTQFQVPQAPAGGLQELKEWTRETLQRLAALQEQPTVQSLIWARVESASDPALMRPAEGMVVFAAPAVLGTAAGFYGYVGGVWKPMTT